MIVIAPHQLTQVHAGNIEIKYLNIYPPICTCTQFSLYFGKNMEGKDLFYFHHYQVNHIYIAP